MSQEEVDHLLAQLARDESRLAAAEVAIEQKLRQAASAWAEACHLAIRPNSGAEAIAAFQKLPDRDDMLASVNELQDLRRRLATTREDLRRAGP